MMEVRAHYIDMSRPRDAFDAPVNLNINLVTLNHTINNPREWFGDRASLITKGRCKIRNTVFLVYHTGDIMYDLDAEGLLSYTGRAIVVREGARPPHYPSHIREDNRAALTAVKRLAKNAREDLPDLTLLDDDVSEPYDHQLSI
ncbi:hypothetical protein NM688_g1621 [Phlebia brevispora]|uniref:Uncharacterized protein n=1 Tax=Phlebia brevispora TaxID=194682 RepID=A0ACC1TAT1_9APHY|nr:hypothetical protein NM688_g1621 [Phlebia brevispora]